MKKKNRFIIILSLICFILPLNIYADDKFHAVGSGEFSGGSGSNVGSNYGGIDDAVILKVVGFRASIYDPDANPKEVFPSKRRYYLSSAFVNDTNDAFSYINGPHNKKKNKCYNAETGMGGIVYGAWGYTNWVGPNGENQILPRNPCELPAIEAGKNCIQVYNNEYTSHYCIFNGCDYVTGLTTDVSNSTSQFIQLEPNANLIFGLQPGQTTHIAAGINFSGAMAAEYLNNNQALMRSMALYLYGVSSEQEIASRYPGYLNDVILIEPIFMTLVEGNSTKNHQYNYDELMQFVTVKDMYTIDYFVSNSFNPSDPDLWNHKAAESAYSSVGYKANLYVPGSGYTGREVDVILPSNPSPFDVFSNSITRKTICTNSASGAIYVKMSDFGGETPCDPLTQCCYNENGDYYTNPNAELGDKTYKCNGQIDSNTKKCKVVTTKCFCDPEEQCCYRKNGDDVVYDKTPNPDDSDPTRLKLSNKGEGCDPYDPDGNCEFKECGCDDDTQCCYDENGDRHSDWTDTGYGDSDRYSKIDDDVYLPCGCNNITEAGDGCGDTVSKSQVGYSNVDDLVCLANFDANGNLRSQSSEPNAAQLYGADQVGCEFEYTIDYPDDYKDHTASRGNVLKWKTPNPNPNPMLTINVTRKCASLNENKLESIGEPTISIMDTAFSYDDQEKIIVGVGIGDKFNLKRTSYVHGNASYDSTLNGRVHIRTESYTYEYYLPYMKQRLYSEAKIVDDEDPQNSDFWPNNLPIAYTADVRNGKEYTRYVNFKIEQGGGYLDYNDQLSCSYNVTDNETKFFYRVIDLNNMNKLDRTLGYNWTDEKGRNARDAIEQTGNYSNLTSKDKFSFTLDPATMIMIREYNKIEANGNGGYGDDIRLTKVEDPSWHWYSPFLYCLYYGNTGEDFCNPSGGPKEIGPINNSVSVTFNSGNNALEAFRGYTSISSSGTTDPYDLETNIAKLINK